MKLVFTSYSSVPEYHDPQSWLKRIEGYTGILERLTDEHEVNSIERIQYQGFYQQKNVLYYFIRLRKKVAHFPFELHRLIKDLQPDVVFINGAIFPLQIIQLRITLGSRTKIIILHRAEKPFLGPGKWAQKLADKFIHAYLFTSQEFGEQWSKNINTKKIHEIVQASSVFYPADKSAARRSLRIKKCPVFLWVGSLTPRKDPITVVKAFLKYTRKEANAKLYMIYQSGELLEEIKKLVKDQDSVILVGHVSHNELLDWYNSADFFITGSNYEGSGVALIEAMSCGCIPITTDFISFRKMTGDGKCGLIFETGNAEALFSILLQTQKLDIEKERASVLKQFHEELSFEAIAKKIKSVIST